jgi:hypothetical protein
MIKRYSSLPLKLEDLIKTLLLEDSLWEILAVSKAESGVFDGGCLIFAQALQFIFGGEVVRLVRTTGVTEHYGLKLKEGIYDGYGLHKTAQDWIFNYKKEEYLPTRDYMVKLGVDTDSEIIQDIKASREIAELIEDLKTS